MDIKTDWKIARALEIVLLLIVLAGAIGLFGGIWTRTTARASGTETALNVRYDRILRVGGRTTLQVSVRNSGNGPASSVSLVLDSRYLEGFTTERILPEPESESTSDGDTRFVFGELQSGQELDVRLQLEAETSGRYKATVRAQLDGARRRTASTDIRTVVLP